MCDIPTADIDIKLSNEVDRLWDAAVSEQTAKTYKTAIHHFLQFVALCNIITCGFLPGLSDDLLIQFVTYCHYALKLSYSTIKLYLSGIRFHYLRAGKQFSCIYNDRLNCILGGIPRTQGASVVKNKNVKRFPITKNILHQITALLKAGVFSYCTDRMMLSVCHMAFFGFMRCGEFTVKNKSDRNDSILIEDISFADDNSHYCLTLRKSKTDPFQMGVQIYVFDVSPFHPEGSLNEFLQLRKLSECPSNAPLFVDITVLF